MKPETTDITTIEEKALERAKQIDEAYGTTGQDVFGQCPCCPSFSVGCTWAHPNRPEIFERLRLWLVDQGVENIAVASYPTFGSNAGRTLALLVEQPVPSVTLATARAAYAQIIEDHFAELEEKLARGAPPHPAWKPVGDLH